MSSKIENIVPKIKIRQVEIRTHAHATEDIKKVSNFLLNLVPSHSTEKDLEYTKLTGTYGQLITDIRLTITKKVEIMSFIKYLGQSLSTQEKHLLETELSNRLDDKLKFYFRLEKQSLAQGKVELAKCNDVVQVIIANLKQSPTIKIKSEDLINYYHSIEFL